MNNNMAGSTELLPQPFAWKTVSAGNVKLIMRDAKFWWNGKVWESYIPAGTSQVFDVGTFEIAKYPITNAQYGKFIEAGGYDQRQWWTDEGWQAKEQNHWVEPLYWLDSKWNQSNYPVVGVSWYEAVAFCQWLSHLTGEKISLPSEQQWQRAAQGDTDRSLAWGGDPDDDEIRCNWDTEGTTPVTQYEGKGDSPFGVVDMTGNVWEWCLTLYETGDNKLNTPGSRIMKGGGWALMYSYTWNIWTTDRMGMAPFHQIDYVGFRCVRS